MPENRITVAKAADRLGVSDKRVYKLIAQDRIKHLWQKGHVFVLTEPDGTVAVAGPEGRK